MAHTPFPDPAAVHPGEAEMLAAVLANLTDDLPKLVYANWLEERGDERGPFLREFVTAARSSGKLPEAGGLSKAWLDLVGFTVVSAARRYGLPIAPNELLRDALPALTFTSEPAADTDLLIGQSKFGGEPDVPPGFVWPEYQGRPLAFLAQFNLSELTGSPACRELPRDGLLSVFYYRDGGVYNEHAGGWQACRFTDLTALERRTMPSGGDGRDQSHPCGLTFAETLAMDDGLDEFSSYEFHREVCGGARHLILGYTHWIQDPPRWFCMQQGVGAQCRHLLTLASDDNPGWMWGDCGALYFGISVDDLKAGRFDRTMFDMQCC